MFQCQFLPHTDDSVSQSTGVFPVCRAPGFVEYFLRPAPLSHSFSDFSGDKNWSTVRALLFISGTKLFKLQQLFTLLHFLNSIINLLHFYF